jgi:hypothetical protein
VEQARPVVEDGDLLGDQADDLAKVLLLQHEGEPRRDPLPDVAASHPGARRLAAVGDLAVSLHDGDVEFHGPRTWDPPRTSVGNERATEYLNHPAAIHGVPFSFLKVWTPPSGLC